MSSECARPVRSSAHARLALTCCADGSKSTGAAATVVVAAVVAAMVVRVGQRGPTLARSPLPQARPLLGCETAKPRRAANWPAALSRDPLVRRQALEIGRKQWTLVECVCVLFFHRARASGLAGCWSSQLLRWDDRQAEREGGSQRGRKGSKNSLQHSGCSGELLPVCRTNCAPVRLSSSSSATAAISCRLCSS